MNRFTLAMLLIAGTLTATGCCAFRCGPCGGGGCGGFSSGGCGDCGDSCGMGDCGSYSDCGGGCGDCGDTCGGDCRPFLGGWFGRWGCGDTYYGNWISYPPTCCEPCDTCGNWVGPSRNSSRAYARCNTSGGMVDGGMMEEGEVIYEGGIVGEPTLTEQHTAMVDRAPSRSAPRSTRRAAYRPRPVSTRRG